MINFGTKGKPRIIRKVVRLNKTTGEPKIARDRKAEIQMEQVKARSPRTCTYYACKGEISAGEDYAKVISPNSPLGLFIKGRHIPMPQDFHFECVPPEARPLVRFFKPKEKAQ